MQRSRRRYGWLDHLLRAGSRYRENNGDHYAAAITYFSVLALFPLLMIGFSVAGFVLFNQPALIADLKAKVIESTPAIGDALGPLVDEAVERRTAVGVIGLLGAVYSGLGWMTNLREALTAQWEQTQEKGSFVRVRGADAFALVGLWLALALSLALTAAGTGFTTEVLELVGLAELRWAAWLLVAVTALLALAGSWLVFLWAIARLPREPVTLRSAAKAALFGAAGFEILKQAATLFLGALSGPAAAVFGPVMGLLVFAYLVSRLLLFVTAWAATDPANATLTAPRRAPAPEAAGTVIRPAITVHSGPDGRTATGLLGAGTVLGLGLGWLLRRR